MEVGVQERLLVLLQERLTEIEDRRGPEPHEDPRFSLAGYEQIQRDQDG